MLSNPTKTSRLLLSGHGPDLYAYRNFAFSPLADPPEFSLRAWESTLQSGDPDPWNKTYEGSTLVCLSLALLERGTRVGYQC